MPAALRAGHPIYWRRQGRGARSGLLLHCGLAHSGAWKGVMERLSDRLNMVAFDLPGHGQSGDWHGPGHIQDAAVAIARSFLEETSGRVELIGHSFGATVLLRLAVEVPDRVSTLTLIEPPFYAAAEGDPAMARQRELDEAFVAAGMRGDREAEARGFVEVWGSGEAWEEMAEEVRGYILDRVHLAGASGPSLNDDIAGILAPGRLERVTAPVLLVRGDRSPPAIPAVLAALARRLPDTRTVVVSGAGHMLPITHPDAVAKAIETHLDRAS